MVNLYRIRSSTDAPLMTRTDVRAEMVRQMAEVLIRDEAWRCQHEAMKALHADGYQTLQIARFVDDAMQVAQQDVVAKEMGDS